MAGYSILFALLLPCVGMSVAFIFYLFLLWYASTRTTAEFRFPEKPSVGRGLSVAELKKLPKIQGSELKGAECAICLDEIEMDQTARLIPGCNHVFHLECADTWLSRNRVCPVCRSRVKPEILNRDNAV